MRQTRVLIVIVVATLLSSHQAVAQFSQQGPKLVATPAAARSEQGISVSVSADGNTALVGGPVDGLTGAVWVWTRNGEGVWTQQAKLVGTGAVGFASQGCSVFLSADGNTAIVGGLFDNDFIGTAWVWTRSGAVWSQQGPKLVASDAVGRSTQGTSVALSADGNTAIIGGRGDNNRTGAAWIWTRSGEIWTQQGAKLVGLAAAQGAAVSLSADGNTALIGSPDTNLFNGAALVWTRSGGVWTQQGAPLSGSDATVFLSVPPASGVPVQQGLSVSTSADGNTAIVGGPYDDNRKGAAWIWTRSGGIWTQQGTKLVGTGALGDAQQGTSVSLSADGSTALVGGSSDNGGIGAGWIWTRSEGGVWTQKGAKLVGAGALGNARQGTSVSLSADGSTAILGGSSDDNQFGAAWVFALNGAQVPAVSEWVLLILAGVLALFGAMRIRAGL